MSATVGVSVLRRIRTVTALALTLALGVGAWSWRYGDPPPEYAARFTDAAELVRGNDVRINDVKVGRVTGVSLEGLEAEVTFTVDDGVVLPDASWAEIRQASLLGDRFVDLHPEGAGQLEPGAVIPSDRTRRALDTEALIAGGAEFAGALTADDVNRLLAAFETAYGDDPERLGRLIDASAASAATFNEAGADLVATIDAVEAMAAGLEPHTDELAASITRFADGLEALGASSEDLAAFTAGLDEFSGAMSGLLVRNRERLRGFGGEVRTVLDEIVRSLPDISRGLAGLYDFNASWACIGDGHFINQTFTLLPEAATIDYGPGHCDPEAGGNRNRGTQSQFVVEGLDAPTPEEWERSARERGEDGG